VNLLKKGEMDVNLPDVNLLKKGEMDVNLPTLFHAIGCCFVMTFWGSPLLVEGIRWIEHTMEG
jgi:hypothetical protein